MQEITMAMTGNQQNETQSNTASSKKPSRKQDKLQSQKLEATRPHELQTTLNLLIHKKTTFLPQPSIKKHGLFAMHPRNHRGQHFYIFNNFFNRFN
jgi:hypothetical protein